MSNRANNGANLGAHQEQKGEDEAEIRRDAFADNLLFLPLLTSSAAQWRAQFVAGIERFCLRKDTFYCLRALLRNNAIKKSL